jgi:hypothetical protein
MPIAQSETPYDMTNSNLHGRAFGILDTVRKLETRLQSLVGQDASVQPVGHSHDPHQMLEEAHGQLTRIMHWLERQTMPTLPTEAPSEQAPTPEAPKRRRASAPTTVVE